MRIRNFLIAYSVVSLPKIIISALIAFSPEGVVGYGGVVNFLLAYVGSFVCAVWLYRSSENGMKTVWGVMGLVAGLSAVIAYLVFSMFKEKTIK